MPDRFAGLILSGGHSLVCAVDNGATRTLVETRDDAMGEVFDKVGKRLGLPFPQGPVVDRFAERGDASRVEQPIPRADEDDLFFSFSGLKSSAIRALERLERDGVVWDPERDREDPPQPILDLLAAFRAAAVDQVVDRLGRLHRREPFELLAVSGGVAANRLLRVELAGWAEERDVDLRLVPLPLSGDNAAMIAFAALVRHRRSDAGDPLTIEAESRIAL